MKLPKLPKVSVNKLDVDAFLEPLALVGFFIMMDSTKPEEVQDALMRSLLCAVHEVGGNDMLDEYKKHHEKLQDEFDEFDKAITGLTEELKNVHDS